MVLRRRHLLGFPENIEKAATFFFYLFFGHHNALSGPLNSLASGINPLLTRTNTLLPCCYGLVYSMEVISK
jgi:hypothetical protein